LELDHSGSFAVVPARPPHAAHRLPNCPHCTRSSKHQIIQGEESHLRKTWPSTAPPNAGPSTHDPISPTTLPAPMPVSTPSLPKAQFESENRLLHRSKGSHRACPQTKGTHNI
jgi:hypothetical protein